MERSRSCPACTPRTPWCSRCAIPLRLSGIFSTFLLKYPFVSSGLVALSLSVTCWLGQLVAVWNTLSGIRAWSRCRPRSCSSAELTRPFSSTVSGFIHHELSASTRNPDRWWGRSRTWWIGSCFRSVCCRCHSRTRALPWTRGQQWQEH